MLRSLLVLSCLLYLVSFFCPGLRFPDGRVLWGYELFLQAIVPFNPGMGAWLSNPLYWATLVLALRGRWKAAALCGAGNVILAACQLAFLWTGILASTTALPAQYLWLLSMVLLAVHSGLRFLEAEPESLFTSGALAALGMASFLLVFLAYLVLLAARGGRL